MTATASARPAPEWLREWMEFERDVLLKGREKHTGTGYVLGANGRAVVVGLHVPQSAWTSCLQKVVREKNGVAVALVTCAWISKKPGIRPSQDPDARSALRVQLVERDGSMRTWLAYYELTRGRIGRPVNVREYEEELALAMPLLQGVFA